MGHEGTQLVGQVLGETYRVERELGGGGMGAVYEASHLRLRRRFAIKVLFPEVAANHEALARFQREAQITSGLGHPHIVEVIDFNHAPDGSPYIVMELLEGRDLEGLLAETGPLPLERAAKIFGQVAAALLAAHAQGIIHRDLKPSNVYLCDKAGQRDFVKVVDFGISKVLGSKSVVTRTQATMGTPGYMSPEQAEGRAAEVDVRTDVFAMGTMLYEMLSGRTPFAGESIPTMLYKIVHQQPPPLRGLRAELPAEVEAVVHRALEKKPDDRFQSMEEMIAALGEALADTSAELRASLLSSAGVSALGAGSGGKPSVKKAPAGGSTTLSSSAVELETKRKKNAKVVGVAIAAVVVLAGVATAVVLMGEGDKTDGAEGDKVVATKPPPSQPPSKPKPRVEKPAPRPPRLLAIEVVGQGRGLRRVGCRLHPAGGAERVARKLPCRFKVLEGTKVRLEVTRGRRAKPVSRSFEVTEARRFTTTLRARKLRLLAAGEALAGEASAQTAKAKAPAKAKAKPTTKAKTKPGTKPRTKAPAETPKPTPKKKDDWGTPKF